jgi:hypothetical protein
LRKQQIAMTHSLAIRLNPANPDHHLWNNNGTCFVHYTIHPTPLTKQRVRKSLRTKNLIQARARRDQLLFKEARAKTAAIKCEGATVKNPPLEITAPVSRSVPPSCVKPEEARCLTSEAFDEKIISGARGRKWPRG